METYIKTKFDLEEAVIEGIRKAGGNPDNDLQFINPNTLIKMGKRAAYIGYKRRHECPNFMVTPINDVNEGIMAEKYIDYYDIFTNETFSLQKIEPTPKRVYLIPFDYEIVMNGYVNMLKECNLKPCVYSPNYLLGLMMQYPDVIKVGALCGKKFVAAEPGNENSIYEDEELGPCFLSIEPGGRRPKLGLVDLDSVNSYTLAFLAEDE